MALKQDSMHFVLCPKNVIKMGTVLNRECNKGFFCPKLGQVLNPQQLTDMYTQILLEKK